MEGEGNIGPYLCETLVAYVIEGILFADSTSVNTSALVRGTLTDEDIISQVNAQPIAVSDVAPVQLSAWK